MVAALMAARQGGTTAVHRWRPRRGNLKHGRASSNQDEPNAHDSTKNGGLWLSSHGDGLGDGAPVSLCTVLELTGVAKEAIAGAA